MAEVQTRQEAVAPRVEEIPRAGEPVLADSGKETPCADTEPPSFSPS
jgi:hypothetical protein